MQTYQQVLSSTDELFHYEYYDWLIQQNRLSDLIEVFHTCRNESDLIRRLIRPSLSASSFAALSSYLSKAIRGWTATSCGSFTSRATSLTMLLRFWIGLPARRGCNAFMLRGGSISNPNRLGLNLEQRIEYLSLAVTNAKSFAPLSGSDDKLAFLEEKLDVARVQLEVLGELRDRNIDANESPLIAALNGSLMNLTELYNEYARPFKLLESSLSILACAGYQDDALVLGLWNEIVEEGMFHQICGVSISSRLGESLGVEIQDPPGSLHPHRPEVLSL